VKSQAVPIAPHAQRPPVHDPVQHSVDAAHEMPARVQHLPLRQSPLTPPPVRAQSEPPWQADPGRPRQAALSHT
jgi:hypothetical protein